MLIGTCTAGILTAFLYPYPLFRYPLILAVMAVLAILRKDDIIIVVNMLNRKILR